LTLKRFDRINADTAYVSNMANAFNELLKVKFILTMSGKSTEQFKNINTHIFNLAVSKLVYYRWPSFFYLLIFKLSYILFFIYFPFYALRKLNHKEQIIFSNDSDLLATAIFWKKYLFYKYLICSDWHMLYNNWKDKFIAKNSDYLIATSKKLKSLLVDRFKISEDKIFVAYGGIDLEKFKNITKEQARVELGLPQDKKLVGYVGLFTTMRMEKGVGTMVKSLKYLDDNIMMVLVGRRDREGVDYGRLAEENGVAERCIIKDFVDYDRMILYEQAMDILVIPYPDKPHFRDWGFPMKIYEYMASGRPIVYSRLDLVEEVLGGNSSYGFEPDNSHDLARAIKEAIHTKSDEVFEEGLLLERMKKYSWDNKAREILKFVGFKLA